MKQFLLKNIVLMVILLLTIAGSVVLIFMILQEQKSIAGAMEEIQANRDKIETINRSTKPNSVEASEKRILSDIQFIEGKRVGVYRHLGNPYRPAFLAFLRNIASVSELKAEENSLYEGIIKDKAFQVEKPKKENTDESSDDEDAEEEKVSSSEDKEEEKTPEEPSEDELKIFDPGKKRVIVKQDESTIRELLSEIYKNIHAEVSNDSDSFVIPDNILEERFAMFAALIQKIIEPPEEINKERTDAYKENAMKKVAVSFAIFANEVQELTKENVDLSVAKQMFLEAIGLPRLTKKLDCKNFMDHMYETYFNANVIPGFKPDEKESTALVYGDEYADNISNFVYSRLNKNVAPTPEMVIPIFRNFQIKEDLVRRLNNAHIRKLKTITPGYLPGSAQDGDPDSPLLVFTYTLEVESSLEEINSFIDSLHNAYKDNYVYVITNLSFSVKEEDLTEAVGLVDEHTNTKNELLQQEGLDAAEIRAATLEQMKKAGTINANSLADANAFMLRQMYKTDDPHHYDYGRPLIGASPEKITCKISIDYYLYRGNNLIPDK